MKKRVNSQTTNRPRRPRKGDRLINRHDFKKVINHTWVDYKHF